MEGNPTGCMGLPDYLGWQWRSKGGIPIVCVPGCPNLAVAVFRGVGLFPFCEGVDDVLAGFSTLGSGDDVYFALLSPKRLSRVFSAWAVS